MSLHKALKRPLSVLAEAQHIRRCFSTRASLAASQYSYNQSSHKALLKIDTQSTSRADKFDAAKRYAPPKHPQGKALVEESSRQVQGSELEKLQSRRWKKGDVYSPHDLSPAEMKKWKQRSNPDHDVFDMLNIHPLDEYKNYAMMAEFTTSMGRIKNPRDTGLRQVNQRRVARAIRRAVGMGWIPSVHVHPELLRRHGKY